MAQRNNSGALDPSEHRVAPGWWPWLVVPVLVTLIALITLLLIRGVTDTGDDCGTDVASERVGDERRVDVYDVRLGEEARCSDGALPQA